MKKKILFISSESSVYHIPIWEAFEYLGFEVHFVDFRGNSILMPGKLVHRGVGKLPSFIKNPLNKMANSAIDKKILDTAIKIKPDYIFATKAKYISIPTLSKMRKIAPTINWYMDRMNNWGSIKRSAEHYDYLFNPDRYIINLLRAEGYNNSYHLPWPAYLEKTATWPDTKNYRYSISFIGSYHPEIFPRDTSFAGLKDLGLNIWGGKSWLQTPLKDCYRGFIVPNVREIKKIYSESKIGLSLDSAYSFPGTSPTLRPFEITSASAMMLGQLYREELPELFEPNKDFIPFTDANELREKARYYLEHEDERKVIAKQGFERTRSEHTYFDRIKKVLDTIENNPRKT